MKTSLFVTGTDTDVGKTVAAAWLMLHLQADYWKPVQSGASAGSTDTDTVKQITQLPENRFFPSAYTLHAPLSPHEAAKRENTRITLETLALPQCRNRMIVEGAGGLMVPLNEQTCIIDYLQMLSIPAVLVARSGLGTINHTLLSLEALHRRNIPVAGIIINGKKSPHNREALEEYGRTPVIAEIDHLEELNAKTLLAIKPEITL